MTAMDAELVALARTVDSATLGRRVREARVARGLTQGQLAGSEMSTAYVSRIESGQRRPDPGLLEGLAGRLGTGVDQLLLGTTRDARAELVLALDWAELSVKTGDAAGALARIDEVLGQLQGSEDALHRRALQVKAAALEATGRLDDAILLLEDLIEAADADATWLVDVTALSRCYRVSGDLTRAVDTGEQAHALLKQLGLAGTAEANTLMLSLAATYFEQGDISHAVRLCRRAIAQAEMLDSPSAKGNSYWNASIMESRTGNAAAAVELGRKALAYIEIGDDQRRMGILRNELGIYLLQSERPDLEDALSTLRRAATELTSSDAAPSFVAYNLISQARAHHMMGDPIQARRVLDRARDVAGENAPLVSADIWVLAGEIEMAEGDVDGARSAYQQAVLLLSSIGADKSAAQTWFELGTLLEHAGDSRGALQAYRSAGASTGLSTVNRVAAVTQSIPISAPNRR